MSDLKIEGNITEILQVETGTSKAGKDWQKINFILRTDNEYNPDICFQIFGEEKVVNFQKFNKIGDYVTVKFNVSSREFNGKYYHNLDAWHVGGDTTKEVMGVPVNEPAATEEVDDLPF